MLKGFKDFLFRGNIVDLAVAVVIGVAFTNLVMAFTESFINPLINVIGGGGENGGTIKLDEDNRLLYGDFLNELITFAITAAVVYFAIVVPMKHILERSRRGEEPTPTVIPEDVRLLAEIRDLLANAGPPKAL